MAGPPSSTNGESQHDEPHVNGVINGLTNGSSTKFHYANHRLGQGRPLRMIMVGAGVSGIAAVKLYKEMFPDRDVNLTIYEKNGDVTGTWLENRYPG
ncbi:hypothetical protein H2204_012787, partial [Knufia peltigerae]